MKTKTSLKMIQAQGIVLVTFAFLALGSGGLKKVTDVTMFYVANVFKFIVNCFNNRAFPQQNAT
jgi:hypothetical protein